MNHGEWFPRWFLDYFHLVSLCLLQCILSITTYTYFYRIIVFACISTFYGLDRLGDLQSYTI